jgi:hypothetical protein
VNSIEKISKLSNVNGSNSVIVEVKAKDAEALLRQLDYGLNCITEKDANLISTELRSLHSELLNSNSQSPTA